MTADESRTPSQENPFDMGWDQRRFLSSHRASLANSVIMERTAAVTACAELIKFCQPNAHTFVVSSRKPARRPASRARRREVVSDVFQAHFATTMSAMS